MSAGDYEAYHEQGRTAVFGDVFERVRVRTVEWILARDPDLRTTGTLLDLGAGEGRYLPLWQRRNPRATIVAADLSALASERSAGRHPAVRHLVADAQEVPLADGSVDAIVSIEVLEHVPSGARMLREVSRLLRSGGWALISTPCGNRGSFPWVLAAISGELSAGNGGGVRFGRIDDPTHLRLYRQQELERLCAATGLEVRRTYRSGHLFTHLAERLELAVKRRVDIRRRSVGADEAFSRVLDAVALLDLRLLRPLPNASTMVLVLRRP
jgi:2-polyprenyl-3-methyl-5-hydroxy-6-metoxy-1,4-benzoquinol methylase